MLGGGAWQRKVGAWCQSSASLLPVDEVHGFKTFSPLPPHLSAQLHGAMESNDVTETSGTLSHTNSSLL